MSIRVEAANYRGLHAILKDYLRAGAHIKISRTLRYRHSTSYCEQRSEMWDSHMRVGTQRGLTAHVCSPDIDGGLTAKRDWGLVIVVRESRENDGDRGGGVAQRTHRHAAVDTEGICVEIDAGY
ncbi:hypothetical protein Tco_1026749 [Tanacetum coccineum]